MMIGALDAPRRQVAEIDYALLWSVLILLFTGLVFVYSASIAIAEGGRSTGHQPAYYLVRQGVFLCIGLVAAAVTFQVPLKLWQRYAPYLFMAGVVLLALVLIPGIGRDVNGARRWISLGFANLQPSELMKLFAVLYAADYTVRKINVMHDLKQAFLPMFGAMAVVGGLLLKEPDFGAFVVIISIAMGILFLGGLKARLFAMLIVGLLIAFTIMIVVSPYRRDRVFGFMDPWADAYGRGYQLSHSLIAFGRGELFGVGLGGSVGLLGCFLGRFFMYQGGDQGRVALALHQLVLQFADAGLDRLHLGISDFLVVGFELKTGQEVVQQKAVFVVLEPCPPRAPALLLDLHAPNFRR